jgi:hypothetical protein
MTTLNMFIILVEFFPMYKHLKWGLSKIKANNYIPIEFNRIVILNYLIAGIV